MRERVSTTDTILIYATSLSMSPFLLVDGRRSTVDCRLSTVDCRLSLSALGRLLTLTCGSTVDAYLWVDCPLSAFTPLLVGRPSTLHWAVLEGWKRVRVRTRCVEDVEREGGGEGQRCGWGRVGCGLAEARARGVALTLRVPSTQDCGVLLGRCCGGVAGASGGARAGAGPEAGGDDDDGAASEEQGEEEGRREEGGRCRRGWWGWGRRGEARSVDRGVS